MSEELTVRIEYELGGIVQGVGFRPALFRLASEAGLGGSVCNRSGSVHLVLEGTPLEIGGFITRLHEKIPKQARLDDIRMVAKEKIEPSDKRTFAIIKSDTDLKGINVSNGDNSIVIPADIAMCRECESEIMDCENRRYGYPFTTCTDCGPRYTVVNDMPYDRERTTLTDFPLCERCMEEYKSPSDRRFHAESVACPDCGPAVELRGADLKVITSDRENMFLRVREELANGAIVALRGIGGYLLAADAFNSNTITQLRKRKNRPSKPFAVMFRNIETLFRFCRFDPEAVKLLVSPEAPIVILPTAAGVINSSFPLQLISPRSDTIGAMIPYSPLHCLLFEPLKGDATPPFDALIMTSGNRGGEPICISNEEAFERLDGIADFFLSHNRGVNLRNDDSICVTRRGAPQIWRRARGYAPQPVKIAEFAEKDGECVLAMGAELKNCIALARNGEVILSPHIGDLESPEAVAGMEEVTECLPRFLGWKPDIIAVDLHPDMQSSRFGRKIAEESGIPVVEIQHHHAHGVSCMAEHGLKKAIALIFDGTGLGTDGNIWGAEAFFIDIKDSFSRAATFAPVPLAGGDAAVRHPVRQAVVRLYDAGIDPDPAFLKSLGVTDKDALLWKTQAERGVNAPLTHAAGRLFDAVSVMLGAAPADVTYEGEAPIALERSANYAEKRDMDFPAFNEYEKEGMLYIDWKSIFPELQNKEFRTLSGIQNEMAYSFHRAVADAAVRMVEFTRDLYGVDDIVLSGGVFMNRLLTDMICDELENRHLNTFIHCNVPPNDGGIAFGQAVLGCRIACKTEAYK